MDLWEYYERVEALILSLREAGCSDEADQVEVAIRGGATAGEILGRLSLTLPGVAASAPRLEGEVNVLVSWTKKALRRRR